ncbi:hypothetical protein [Halomonas sp. I5-271120]|uniref:hypothetical protein n=1 Tax=Halomonas sp. I5-271120 TaxID=3061632 RepID=UPI00271452E3|nr:hypothetical protein [Halomonas sp. I5-271120]
MFNWIARHKPPVVWIIKQLDDLEQLDAQVLHLCGQGEAIGPGSVRKRRKDLAKGDFQGQVRFSDSGITLHANLFSALVPVADLEWLDQRHVRWQARLWRVAWVPERCWAYRGPLTIDDATGPEGSLISTEDMSIFREKLSTRNTPAPSSRWWELVALGDEQRRFDYTSIPDSHRLAANSRKR